MILILSRTIEFSTDQVIEWIESLGGSYIRLNESFLRNFETPFEMKLQSQCEAIDFHEEHMEFDLDKINIVWYRKWLYNDSLLDLIKLTDNKVWAATLFNHIHAELNSAGHFLLTLLEKKKWVDDPAKIKGLKKLSVLRLAGRLGLKVPNTIITNSKKVLIDFLKINKRIITKPISEITFFNSAEFEFLAYTVELTSDSVLQLNDWFLASQFQELLEKKFDIRTFYLAGQCYSMAILSQTDMKSHIDFRNYNNHHPNRMIPYTLPKQIETKLTSLMNAIGLICGSIDLILTTSGEYYFLEINPVGQFGMTSFPCNYNLEYKLAKYLIDNDTPN
jgi:ATP-GRASP peptide maturase of grasp-with-spasm system